MSDSNVLSSKAHTLKEDDIQEDSRNPLKRKHSECSYEGWIQGRNQSEPIAENLGQANSLLLGLLKTPVVKANSSLSASCEKQFPPPLNTNTDPPSLSNDISSDIVQCTI